MRKNPFDGVATGQALYKTWHQREADPSKESTRKNNIPTQVPTLGVAKYIIYSSDKWSKDGTEEDYIHDFDSGPKLYHRSGKGFKVSRDALLGNDNVIVKLGLVIELGYVPEGSETEIMFPLSSEPPVLCSSTDAKCLIILTPSPILIRGGKMEVKDVGIVK